MKEKVLCHICGRKIKAGTEICKNCKPDPSERIAADCRATYHPNILVSPPVNLVMTDRRLLMFEDMQAAVAAGAAGGMGGGLLGAAIGAAASEAAGSSMKSINGSLKKEIALSSIENIEVGTKKQLGTVLPQITISVADSKPLKFTLTQSANKSMTGEMFTDALIAATNK